MTRLYQGLTFLTMGILLFVLVTFVLSVIVGLFCTLTISPSKKNQVQGFELFTDICVGSFVGGIIGSIIGLIIFAVIMALTPEADRMFLGLAAFAYLTPFYIFIFCWLVGILAGASKSIRNSLDLTFRT